MYIPTHFEESRPEVLHQLMAQHPLGVLVTTGSSGLDANHLPFDVRPHEGTLGTLHCHVARANPVWQALEGQEVLAIFRAADAYISPQWYPSKQEHHRQVPTWNYLAAHAWGRVTVHEDERYLRALVGRLTRTHEAGQPVPWKMADAPRDYLDDLLQQIVGLEITITRLQGKAKLSQTKEARDILGAADALGQHPLGQAMRAALTTSTAQCPPHNQAPPR